MASFKLYCHRLVVEFAVRNQCLSKGRTGIVKSVFPSLDEVDSFTEDSDFRFFVVHDWFHLFCELT